MIRKSQSDLILSDRFMYPTYYMKVDKSLGKCRAILNSIQEEFNKTKEQYLKQYSKTDGESKLQDSSENDNNVPQTAFRQFGPFKKRKYERKPLDLKYKNTDNNEKGNLKKYSSCKNGGGSYKKIYVDFSDNSSASENTRLLTKKDYSSSLTTDSEHSENLNAFESLLNSIVDKQNFYPQYKLAAGKRISYDQKNVLVDLENFNKKYNKEEHKMQNKIIALDKYQTWIQDKPNSISINKKNRSLENSSLESSEEAGKWRDVSDSLKSYSNSAINFQSKAKTDVKTVDKIKNQETSNVKTLNGCYCKNNENTRDQSTCQKLRRKESETCKGNTNDHCKICERPAKNNILFKIPKLDVRHLEMFLNIVKKTQSGGNKPLDKNTKSDGAGKIQFKSILNDDENFESCIEEDENGNDSDKGSEIFEDAVSFNETRSNTDVPPSRIISSSKDVDFKRKTVAKIKNTSLLLDKSTNDKSKCSYEKKKNILSDGTVHISPEDVFYSYKQEIKPCYFCDDAPKPRKKVSIKYYSNNKAILDNLCRSQYRFLKRKNRFSLESTELGRNVNVEKMKHAVEDSLTLTKKQQEKRNCKIDENETLQKQNKDCTMDSEKIRKSKIPVKVKSKTRNKFKKMTRYINTNRNENFQSKEKSLKTSESQLDKNFGNKPSEKEIIEKMSNVTPIEKTFNKIDTSEKSIDILEAARIKLEENKNVRKCLSECTETEQKNIYSKIFGLNDNPFKENCYFKTFERSGNNKTFIINNSMIDNGKNTLRENLKQEKSVVGKLPFEKSNKNFKKNERSNAINMDERFPKLKVFKRNEVYVHCIDRSTNTSESKLLCCRTSKCTQTSKDSTVYDDTFRAGDCIKMCASAEMRGSIRGEYFQIPIMEKSVDHVYKNDNFIESSVGKGNKYGGKMYLKKHNVSYNKKIKKSRSGGGLLNRGSDGNVHSISNTQVQNNYIYALSPVPVGGKHFSKGEENDWSSSSGSDGFYSICNSTILTSSKNNFFAYRSEEDQSCGPMFKEFMKYNYKPIKKDASIKNTDQEDIPQCKLLFPNNVWEVIEPNIKKTKHVSFKKGKRTSSYCVVKASDNRKEPDKNNIFSEEIKSQLKNNNSVLSNSKLQERVNSHENCPPQTHVSFVSNSENNLLNKVCNEESQKYTNSANEENKEKNSRLICNGIQYCIGELMPCEIRKPLGVKFPSEVKVLNWIQRKTANKKNSNEKEGSNMNSLKKSYEKRKVPSGYSLLGLDINNRRNIYSVLSKKLNESNSYDIERLDKNLLSRSSIFNVMNSKKPTLAESLSLDSRQDESISNCNNAINTKTCRGKGDNLPSPGFQEYLGELKNTMHSGYDTSTKINGNLDVVDSKIIFNISASMGTILSITADSGDQLLVSECLSLPHFQDHCQELDDNVDDNFKLKPKTHINKKIDSSSVPIQSSTKLYSMVNIKLANEKTNRNKEVNMIGRVFSIKNPNKLDGIDIFSLNKKLASVQDNAMCISSEQKSSSNDLTPNVHNIILKNLAEKKVNNKSSKNKNIKTNVLDKKVKSVHGKVKVPKDPKPPFTPYVNKNFKDMQRQMDSYRSRKSSNQRWKFRPKSAPAKSDANDPFNDKKITMPKKLQTKEYDDFQTISLFTTSRQSLDSVSTQQNTEDSSDKNLEENRLQNKQNLPDNKKNTEQMIQENISSSSDPQVVIHEKIAAFQNPLTKNKRSKSLSLSSDNKKSSLLNKILETDLSTPALNESEDIGEHRSKASSKNSLNKVYGYASNSSGNSSSEMSSTSSKSSSNSLNDKDSKKENLDCSVIKSLEDKIKNVLPKHSPLKKSLLKKVSKHKMKKSPSDLILDCEKDVFGAPLVDSLDLSFYNEHGKPIVNIFGCKLYDKDGMPKRGAYGKPIHGALRKEILQALEGQEIKRNFLHRRNKKFEEELITVLEKVNGLKTDLYGRVYDSYGRPLFDRYGNLLYDLNGNPLCDAFGRPLRDSRTGKSLIKPKFSNSTPAKPFTSASFPSQQRITGGGLFIHDNIDHKTNKKNQEISRVPKINIKSENKNESKIKKQVSFDMKPIIVARCDIKPRRKIRSSSFINYMNDVNKKVPSILKKNEIP